MASLPKTIGVIGLGAMGFPMTENLVKKLPSASKIFVNDISASAVDKLVSQYTGRVAACFSACEVADRSDTVITMLPEGSHSRDVYLNEATGICATNCSNKMLLDCSTIDTATSLEIRAYFHKAYPTAAFYDAPVSGGVAGAESATMTFMVGCAPEDDNWEKIEAVLSLLGGTIIPCGGPALGLTAKLCNNYCSGLIAIATGEAMDIGIRSGMDPRVLSRVFHTSLAQSAINDRWNPCPGVCLDAPSSRDYAPGFRVELMRKDFRLAVESAERVGARLALGRTGLAVYEGACADERCKGRDSRVVYRYLGGREDWS